jgi:hypothetical protein
MRTNVNAQTLQFVGLFVLASFAVLAPLRFADATPDDVVARFLRLDQRQSAVILSRNGEIRPLPILPTSAPSTRLVSTIPTAQSVSSTASSRPPTPPGRLEARTAAWFVSSNGNNLAYVPTAFVAKPMEEATRSGEHHDLAWQYKHRFDTPQPQELQIPGKLVRTQVSSPFDIASGAFHGVRSKNGWSALRVRVAIPCGASRFQTALGLNLVTGKPGQVDQETGYINIGGWGSGPYGTSVDAGLQKASAQAEHDAYAMYWKYDRNRPYTSKIRFPCGGPDVAMALYPISDTRLVFSVSGLTDGGERATLTVIQETRPSDGWVPGGGTSTDGIILKRIVEIAQPYAWRSDHPARFRSGTYFGITSPTDPTPRVVWRSCEVGRVESSGIEPLYRPWTEKETWDPRSSGIYTDWPVTAIVRRPSEYCDDVGIYLSGS